MPREIVVILKNHRPHGHRLSIDARHLVSLGKAAENWKLIQRPREHIGHQKALVLGLVAVDNPRDELVEINTVISAIADHLQITGKGPAHRDAKPNRQPRRATDQWDTAKGKIVGLARIHHCGARPVPNLVRVLVCGLIDLFFLQDTLIIHDLDGGGIGISKDDTTRCRIEYPITTNPADGDHAF